MVPLAVFGSTTTKAADGCAETAATIVGTPNSDHLRGTSDDDVIAGRGGDDKISGGGGDDLICGNAGADEVNGGAGADQIRGGIHGDSLGGQAGDDLLRGGNGADALRGGGGSDSCLGGAGPDQAHGCEDGSDGSPPDDGQPPDDNPPPPPGNQAPTDIGLSSSTVDENQPVGTTVGTLSATDSDAGDTHTYSLVAGTGDTDNASFQLDGATLKTNAVFDFEAKSTYSIRVRADDGNGGSFEKQFAITITDVVGDAPPTNISLSNASVGENQSVGTNVGTLSAADPDPGDTHTFALVSGSGDTDNASFQIAGSTLKTNAVFDFESDSSYSIRVSATDSTNRTFEKQFTITITNVNETPVAANDSYSGAIGNTKASRGVSVTAEPVVSLSGNVLTQNDSDPDGDSISAVAETVSTTGGGSATINANGSFTYVPGVGDKNQTDSFTYTVTDGTAQSTGTANIAISDNIVWYLDRDRATNGDGRSTAPLNNLAGVNGAGGAGDADGSGDVIFLYDSSTSYTGGLPLETSEKLIGEPEGLVVNGATLVAAAGSNPMITNSGGSGITLAGSTVIRHVNVSATSGAGISGGAVSGVDAASMTIANPGGDGVSLTDTDNVSFQSTTISGADHAGVDGTGVTGFAYTNGTITNAGDAKTSAADAAFAFNSNPAAATNNVDGTVTITGNTITNPYGGGIDIFNRAGTISDAQISNNTISSATTQADSKEDGISLNLLGLAGSVASLTKATIQNNNIQNFPSGHGLRIEGGNSASSTAPSGTYGTPGSATNVVAITGNLIKGDATTKLAGSAISTEIVGRAGGNFAITNNGTVANPLANSTESAIAAGTAGDGDATFTITGNVLAPDNDFGSPGILLASDTNIQGDAVTLSDPDIDATVSNNTISDTDGPGISVLQRNSNGSLDLKLQNNNVSAPSQSVSGVRVDNGSSADVAWNPTMCAQISSNTANGGPVDGFGNGPPGISIAKRSTSASTYVFGIVGLSPSPATAAQAQAHLATQNPASSLGSGFYAGLRAAVIAGDNFTSCTLPF